MAAGLAAAPAADPWIHVFMLKYVFITNPTSQRLDIQIGGQDDLLLQTRAPNKSGTICYSKRFPRKWTTLCNSHNMRSNFQCTLGKNEMTKSGSKSPAAYLLASTVPSKNHLFFKIGTESRQPHIVWHRPCLQKIICFQD